MSELQQSLVHAIKTYVAESPLNALTHIDGSPIFEEPLVGFADGDDSLFREYKTIIGEFHFTPREILALDLQNKNSAEPTDFPRVSVISWVLPTANKTKLSNRRMTDGPSVRWNNTRFQGEDFNDSLRRYVVSQLEQQGYLAAAPLHVQGYKTHQLPNGLASNWSERHTAYAAGLGTFGLSDGFITARGIAHRLGSVVTNAPIPASAREYTRHNEYCLHARDGSCGLCIGRCPTGAISQSGHDKILCRETLSVKQAHFLQKPGYIGIYSGCGLCQTKVPCESRIPRPADARRLAK
jgi:epoxyqueuosine reductase QueG